MAKKLTSERLATLFSSRQAVRHAYYLVSKLRDDSLYDELAGCAHLLFSALTTLDNVLDDETAKIVSDELIKACADGRHGIECSARTIRFELPAYPYPAPCSKKEKKKAEDRVLQKGLPGRRTKWPLETVEKAAAVWAVQALWKEMVEQGTVKQKKLTKEDIQVIKEEAAMAFRSAEVTHDLPLGFVLTTP